MHYTIMGKKSWILSVKKVFSQIPRKKRNRNQRRLHMGRTESSSVESPSVPHVSYTIPPPEEVKLTEVQNGRSKEAYSVVATTVAAEAVTKVVKNHSVDTGVVS